MPKKRLGRRWIRFVRGLGPSWTPLETHLVGFCALWGACWAPLGGSWGPLGRFLGVLGRRLTGLQHFWGTFCLPGTPQASILQGLETCWAKFWKAWGACLAMSFAASRALSYNAFMIFYVRSRRAFAFTNAFASSPLVRRSVRSTWNFLIRKNVAKNKRTTF